MDGAKVIKVRMYEGAAETWREWGRSLDLKDAASWGQTWGDVWFLLSVQGLPLLVVLGYLLLGCGRVAVAVGVKFIFVGDSVCFEFGDRPFL